MQMPPIRAAIVGLSGPTLTEAERALLRSAPPAGIILFARNIRDRAQLAALMAELRGILACGSVLMIDQEGGRVARLRPPHWRAHPACATLGSERAAWLHGALIGLEAAAAGFDVVCAPVLDVRRAGASDVVGDRAFSGDPDTVARFGTAMAAGLLAAGVQPVAKHAPGHGRATADSHLGLPRVAGLDDADLLAFAQNTHLPWWMTAHVLYDGIDDRPATLSRRIIDQVIRGRLGFTGLLVSDDLAMGALEGTPAERARAAWDAGCDVALYCPGDPAATAAVLRAAPPLDDVVKEKLRAARVLAERSRQTLDAGSLDAGSLAAERDALVACPA